MDMKDFVEKTKKKYCNVRDIEFVAKTENIKLFYIEFSDNIDGVAFVNGDNVVIAINESLDTNRKIEAFWHEYYHLNFSVGNYEIAKLFLPGPGTFFTKDEIKADIFAALMLIDQLPEECDVYSIMEEFDVSQHTAEVRIKYALSIVSIS